MTRQKVEDKVGSRCGTTSGHRKHQRLGEKPCDACARAKREYDQRRLSATELTLRNRMFARAQGRATTRLRALYPEVWRILYAEEVARVKREGA